ncbi:hypothetical protein [uncultured Robinsoniella sp.]
MTGMNFQTRSNTQGKSLYKNKFSLV